MTTHKRVLTMSLAVCVWLCVLTAPARAQATRFIRTGGHVNGRFWQGLLLAEKDGFISGYWAAAQFIQEQQDGKCSECRMSPWGYTNAEVRRMLDTFYKQPENAPIPIYWALGHLWQKLNNKQSPQEAERYLQTIREWASSAAQEAQ